jgi:hypothetical protein
MGNSCCQVVIKSWERKCWSGWIGLADGNCPCEQLLVHPGQGDKDTRARGGRSSRRHHRGSGQRVCGVEASRYVFHVFQKAMSFLMPSHVTAWLSVRRVKSDRTTGG